MKTLITPTAAESEILVRSNGAKITIPATKVKPKIIRVTTVPVSLKVLLKDQLRFMSEYFDVIAVSSPGKLLQQVSEVEKVRTCEVRMTRSITLIDDIRALWNLYCLFRKERPAIVHSHTPKAGILAMMAAAMSRVPVRMHTVAGLPLMEAKGIKKLILVLAEKVTSLFANRLYPNSFSLADYMIRNRLAKPSKIQVLGHGSSNGVNCDYFKVTDDIKFKAGLLRLELGIAAGDFVFIYIGRIVKDKGINELVSAFISVHATNPAAKLLLVGAFEQELDPISNETMQNILTRKEIIHIDFQEDVRPYMAAADVLVFPSYREGFPNVPMQAGCMELPVIVTNINGCNEIVEHGRNGLLIAVKDEDAVKSAMMLIMSDGNLRNSLKSNARRMILNRYDQPFVWKLLLKEYNKQLTNARVSSFH